MRALACLLVLLPVASAQATWPTHLGNNRRGGASAAGPTPPLSLHWTHASPHAPRAAWGDPARGSYWQRLDELAPRVTFDRAYHPVAAGDAVYYASSVDDQVRCLDLATGALRWRAFADGPLRCAPALAGDALFIGGDDGCVRAYDRRDGTPLWTTRIAPRDRRVPGNGRIVSAWPVRTGVVVQDGVVYTTAGLFPSQGTYAAALDAATGALRWRVPLEGSFSPQGYLLASDTRLYVPNGRATPFALDLADGSFEGSFGGPGGAYALLAGDALVSGPGNSGELALSGTEARDQLAHFEGKRMVVAGGISYLLTDTQLSAVDREKLIELRARQARLRAEVRDVSKHATRLSGEDKVAAEGVLAALGRDLDAVAKDLTACVLWVAPARHPHALILAGEVLYAGGDGEVVAFARGDGERLWSAEVEGAARGLAACGERLLVATDRGALHAFGPPDETPRVALAPPVQPTTDGSDFSRVAFFAVNERPGYAVVTGSSGRSVARALARSSMHALWVLEDEQLAHGLREELASQHLYGPGMAILVGDPHELPLTPGFANIVVDLETYGRSAPTELSAPLARWLVPHGGEVLTSSRALPPTRAPDASRWDHAFADAGNSASCEDATITAPFDLQWFGGPGPSQMIDRHLRTAPPVSRDGRLFIPALDRIVAVDAFNGTVIWEREVEGFSRTGVPFDAGHMMATEQALFIAAGGLASTLDPTSGSLLKSIEVPSGNGAHWGWLAHADGRIYGSAQRPDASRRAHSREDVVEQYRDRRPLVVAHEVFAYEAPVSEPTVAWRHEAGAVLAMSLAAGGERVYMLESEADAQAKGRLTLNEFVEGGAELVALSAVDGAELWRVPYDPAGAQHVVYVCYQGETVVTVGSYDKDGSIWYAVAAHDAATGELRWRQHHANNRTGTGGDHGEQVHHPVLSGGRVIAEPFAYDLVTGKRIADWSLPRRQGCGTIAGSGACLFYRDGRPTVLDIAPGATPAPLTQVSRPGCWISVVPACGLVLLPEASSGCVCSYPIQTSMAFRPRR